MAEETNVKVKADEVVETTEASKLPVPVKYIALGVAGVAALGLVGAAIFTGKWKVATDVAKETAAAAPEIVEEAVKATI